MALRQNFLAARLNRRVQTWDESVASISAEQTRIDKNYADVMTRAATMCVGELYRFIVNVPWWNFRKGDIVMVIGFPRVSVFTAQRLDGTTIELGDATVAFMEQL